jgi:hypothetical protein
VVLGRGKREGDVRASKDEEEEEEPMCPPNTKDTH